MERISKKVGNEVLFTYIRTEHGVITVASNKKTGHVGVAYQSSKDQFVKEVGRRIAVGRMEKLMHSNECPQIKVAARRNEIIDYVAENSYNAPTRYKHYLRPLRQQYAAGTIRATGEVECTPFLADTNKYSGDQV